MAHSGANAPVSLLLDRHPERVRRVIWVDSGPIAPGAAEAPDALDDGDELPLPSFAALGETASLEGLSDDAGHWPMWSRPADLARVIAAAGAAAD